MTKKEKKLIEWLRTELESVRGEIKRHRKQKDIFSALNCGTEAMILSNVIKKANEIFSE